MKAYNNDPNLKGLCIAALHDAVITGKLTRKSAIAWTNSGYCTPIGALVKHYNAYHLAAERIGFPPWFAYLIDTLFRGMNKRDGEWWAHQVFVAVRTGSLLERKFTRIAEIFFTKFNDIRRASKRRRDYHTEIAIQAYLYCQDEPSSYWKKKAKEVLEILFQ